MALPSASAVTAQLASSSADAAAGALSQLRSALRVRPDELSEYGEALVPPGDARLRLAVELVDAQAVARLLEVGDVAEQRDLDTLMVLVYQVLSQLLALLSVHQPNHDKGDVVLQALLDGAAPWMARLQGSVARCLRTKRESTTHDTVLVLVALKLLTAMVQYARGKYATSVWERFHFRADVHKKLLAMRKWKRAEKPASVAEPDVRTQYMMWLLSMLAQPHHASLKTALLELGDDGVPLLFKGLAADPPEVVRYVLLVLHEELFKDTHVPRGAKAKLFQAPHACASLVALYARENDTVSHTSVADLVHHFFLSVATHPGFGLCFADRGWYGRDDGPPLHNKLLLGLVRQLRVADDLRQQELALRILRACPELVAPVLARHAIEIHGDAAFLSHMAFVGRVLQLPVPPMAADPPPAAAVLASTVPESVSRVLAKACQHTDALVQYYACLVTACALQRVCAVQAAARRAARAAEEDDDGAWTQALRHWQPAWRTRFPHMDTMYTLMHSEQAMRRVAALRVVALYLEALPSMTYDTHWDAGRLLTSAFLGAVPAPLRWDRVAQAHVLAILRGAAPAIDFTNKVPAPWPGAERRSYWHFLLAAHVMSDEPLRAQSAALLLHTLQGTALFAHDADEAPAWLAALERADALPVLAFLDECLLRCIKTPYRYAERVRVLAGADGVYSPLLASAAEQALVRLQKRLWQPPASAAPVVAYLSRVCVQLLACGKPARPLLRLAQQLHAAATPEAAHALRVWEACLRSACGAPGADLDALTLAPAWLWRRAAPDVDLADVDAVWPLVANVWLERIAPGDAADAPPAALAATLDALTAWAQPHALEPAALERHILRHPMIAAWLARGDPTFLRHVVPLVCACARPGGGYAACLAPLVDVAVQRVCEAPHSDVLLACAAQLAPYAHAAHVVRIVRAVDWASAAPAQLEALAALVRHVAVDGPALAPLLAQWPTLVARVPASPAACRVLDELWAATLPPGLDPFRPVTRGSYRALGLARRYLPPSLAPLEGHDATLARTLYVVPGAPAWPTTPYARCAATLLRADADAAPLLDACWTDAAAATALAALRARAPDDALDAPMLAALRAAPPPHAWQAPHAWLVSHFGADVQAAWLEGCAPHLTRRFAEDDSDTSATQQLVRAATALARRQPLRAHLAEPLLTAIVHHRPQQVHALRLGAAVARRCPLKEAAATRLVHALLARSDVVAAARDESATRRAMVSLLVQLARHEHHALRTPATLARVLYLYRGTLAPTDAALWAWLQAQPLGADTWAAWTAAPALVPSSLTKASMLAALLSLQPSAAHATCVHMPRTAPATANVDAGADAGAAAQDDGAAAAYEPYLVLNLVAGAMLERELGGGDGAHLTGLQWLAILRTGALGVVVCALSSHRAPLRALALKLLGKVYASLEPTEFREKPLVLLVLERLRDLVPPPPPTSISGQYTSVPWLPSMTCLFVAHCLRAIATPFQPMFPVLYRFLLQRPRLDDTDVPLLYNLLQSTSDDSVAERTWILRFLHEALAAHGHVARALPHAAARVRAESSMFKRRHVADLVLALYTTTADPRGGHADPGVDARHAALAERWIDTAAQIPHVAQELVTRRGWLAWITAHVATRALSEAQATYWATLLLHTAAPPTLESLDQLRRLAELDRQSGHAIVTSLLLAAAHVARRAPPAWSVARARPYARLLRQLLAYAAVRGTDAWTATDTDLVVKLLPPLVVLVTAEDAPDVALDTLHAVLLSASLGTDRRLSRCMAALPWHRLPHDARAQLETWRTERA